MDDSYRQLTTEEKLERYQQNMKKIKEIAPSKAIAETEPCYYGDVNYIESGKIGTIYMVEYTSIDTVNKNNPPIAFMSSNAHRTKEGCVKELEDNNFRWKQTLFGEDTNRYTKTSYGISDYAEILEFYIVD